METITFSPAIVVLVPIVIALTSLFKIYLGSRWAPLIALVLGIAGAFLFPTATLGVTIISGIVIGLTASGLYSGVKTTVN